MKNTSISGLASLACVGALTLGLSVPVNGQTSQPSRDRPERKMEKRMRDKAKAYADQPEKAIKKAVEAPGKISWTAGKVGQDEEDHHYGHFEKWYFTRVSMPNGTIDNGEVEVMVDITSLKSDNSKLTAHLLSNDFFKSDDFSYATFVIKNPKKKDDAENTYTAEGHLTMLGVTSKLPVEFTVEGKDPLMVKGKATIQRADFKMGDGKYTEENSKIWNEVPVTFETKVAENLVVAKEAIGKLKDGKDSGKEAESRPARNRRSSGSPSSRPTQ